MATSNSTNFSTTRDDIIKGALRLCGALALGETPTTPQVTEAAEALNMMVKAWEADGMALWAVKDYSLALTLSANSYEIGLGKTVNIPKPLKITQAILHDTSSNVDIPMRVITREEYNRLGNKVTTGMPIQVYYEPLINYGILHTFPAADSTSVSYKQIKFVYMRPFEDFDASTDEPDFPQEWYEAIKYGLAVRLAGEYGVNLEDRNQLLKEANMLKDTALGFGTEEGSFYITADYRKY
jgi:hypothetical protein